MEDKKRQIDKVGGRKFALVIVVIIASTILLLGKFMSLEEFKEWANAIWLTLSSYFAGNVGSKYTTRRSNTSR